MSPWGHFYSTCSVGATDYLSLFAADRANTHFTDEFAGGSQRGRNQRRMRRTEAQPQTLADAGIANRAPLMPCH
jgi:hypothetical protein